MNDEIPESTLPEVTGDGTEGRFRGFLRWLYCLLQILWLCGMAVVFLAVGAWVFILNDQGQDVLRMLTDPVGLRRPTLVAVFTGSVLCWSLATWYTSRLLLTRRLPGFPLPAGRSAGLREWVPRILGALPPAIMAAAFSNLETSERALAALFAAFAVALFLFYWGRRQLPWVTERSARKQLDTLPWGTRIILAISVLLTFVLLTLFVLHPVGPARFLGAASILVLAGTSMLLFSSIVLTYLPLANGYPNLLAAAFLWAVLCSPFNDNHEIHTVKTPVAAPAGGSLQQAFRQWLEQARSEGGTPPGEAPAPYPVFIVAAEGGGIRAAYWTAAVLAHAAAQRVDDPEAWRRHLFALSGISGGSLGAAVHVVQLRKEGISPAQYFDPAKDMLGKDHLSPVLAFMLFPDSVQRFWIRPVLAFDRARGLESSWEEASRTSLHDDSFSEPFLNLWKGQTSVLPALLLNSVRVETGQRVMISNLPLSDDFVDTLDLLRPGRGSLRGPLNGITLAAAVHLSARSAYISPAARVESRDGKLWGRLVDGGYFENSGAITAADLVHAICPQWNRGQGGAADGQIVENPLCDVALPVPVMPVVLLIKNEPHAASLCDTYVEGDSTDTGPFTELRPPIDALLATRGARARVAERSIVRLVEGRDRPSGDCSKGCVLELSLARSGASRDKDDSYVDPPLGWSLSESSRRAMDQRFADEDIKGQLQCIASLARGEVCTTARRCGR